MASCIPTLGPLYEMLRGKRSWTSHRSYPYKNSTQIPSSDRFRSRNYALGSNKDRDLFETNIGTVREGSQESILQEGGGRPVDKIQRTDQVVVEYEMRDLNGHQ